MRYLALCLALTACAADAEPGPREPNDRITIACDCGCTYTSRSGVLLGYNTVSSTCAGVAAQLDELQVEFLRGKAETAAVPTAGVCPESSLRLGWDQPGAGPSCDCSCREVGAMPVPDCDARVWTCEQG